MSDVLKREIAEELCSEINAQMGCPPCSYTHPPSKPHCDECLGLAMRVMENLAAWNTRKEPTP